MNRDGQPQHMDSWRVAESVHEGRRLVVRVLTGVRTATVSRHPIRIGVAVVLGDRDGGGMPTSGELTSLAAFEDGLVRLTAGHAMLVAILTLPGVREFVLYALADAPLDSLHGRLRDLLPSHRVQMTRMTDPEWSVYAHLLNLIDAQRR